MEIQPVISVKILVGNSLPTVTLATSSQFGTRQNAHPLCNTAAQTDCYGAQSKFVIRSFNSLLFPSLDLFCSDLFLCLISVINCYQQFFIFWPLDVHITKQTCLSVFFWSFFLQDKLDKELEAVKAERMRAAIQAAADKQLADAQQQVCPPINLFVLIFKSLKSRNCWCYSEKFSCNVYLSCGDFNVSYADD